MKRDPEHCQYREPIENGGDRAGFACALVRRILGTKRQDAARVKPEVCRECCGFRLPSTSHFNTVIASLVYQGAKAIAMDPNSSWREREEAVRSRRHAVDHLALVGADGGDQGQTAGCQRDPRSPPDSIPARRGGLRWAVGMLTAPRPVPTIDRALASLQNAGFSSVHIFAEPGSWVPDRFAHLPRTVHGRLLGNLGNFYTSLASLWMLEPHADCYAVFQDDVCVAEGLRAWCDRQLWPNGAGLVSLYTCGAQHDDASGWRILSRGMCHTFGALAFVFRSDILKDFLSDGRLLEMREAGLRAGDDAAIGEWATRRGFGIAYHTPSLVDHIGVTSAVAANGHGTGGPLTVTRAVRSVSKISKWKPPTKKLGKVGLVGWNTASGLGYVNRGLATRFPIDKWLVPEHRVQPTLKTPRSRARIDVVPLDLSIAEIKAWLRGLDWVVFVEHPYFRFLVGCARDGHTGRLCTDVGIHRPAGRLGAPL